MKQGYGLLRVLITLSLVWGALFYTTLSSAVAFWARSETFNHCFIILPICIYLIHQRWRYAAAVPLRANWWFLIPISLVALIWSFGVVAQLLVIEQGAAFLLLPLLICCVCGNQVAKILWFPLLFWMFSVPAGEFLVPSLQNLTANISVELLQLTGIPVYREGLYIAIPGGLFEVAVACSGIRYLIASVCLGTLFAYLNYNSARKRIIFVVFAFLLPLLANGLRAYGIIIIAHLSEMEYATGVDHLIYGWLFFGVVILIMFALGSLWADPIEKLSIPASEEGKNSGSAYWPAMLTGWLIIVFFLLYTQQILHRGDVHKPQMVSALALTNVSHEVKDKRAWYPRFRNPTTQVIGQQHGQDVYLAFYAQNIQGSELINSTNLEFNKKAWSLSNIDRHSDFVVVTIVNTAGTQRHIAYTYLTPLGASAAPLKVKLQQIIQAMRGGTQDAGFVAVSQITRVNQDSKQEVIDRMQQIIAMGYAKVFRHD